MFVFDVCDSRRTVPFRHSLAGADSWDAPFSLCFSFMVSLCCLIMGSGTAMTPFMGLDLPSERKSATRGQMSGRENDGGALFVPLRGPGFRSCH